jgi:hypothetical protein
MVKDPTRYRILHDIIQSDDTERTTLLSIEYRFNYPERQFYSSELSPTEASSPTTASSPVSTPTHLTVSPSGLGRDDVLTCHSV